jgi:cell division septation protein DedD
MKSAVLLGASLVAAAIGVARAEPALVGTEEGTTWNYEMREELGGPAAAAPTMVPVTVSVGRQTFGGKEFLKFETKTDDVVTRTELMMLDEHGLVCHARAGKDGRMARLDPPQTVVPAAVKVGDSWESDGEAAGMEVHQLFHVVSEEPVRVAAGSYRAFHIHCEDASVMSVTLDRWFCAGVGFVKETTVVRGPTGGLLQKSTLELQKPPEVIAKPEPTPSPTPVTASTQTSTPPMRGPQIQTEPTHPNQKLSVEVSTDPTGGMKTEFKSDVANIYVRWRGHNLPEGAKVRVAWIAEDVGDLVEPNFIIDETESVAPAPDATARFTLGRPPDGWAEGKYRVEFYVNDELEETVRVTIVK